MMPIHLPAAELNPMASPTPRVMVLLNGVPWPELSVTRLVRQLGWGVCEADVSAFRLRQPITHDDGAGGLDAGGLDAVDAQQDLIRQLEMGHDVLLAMPLRLSDGDLRWQVLAQGRLQLEPETNRPMARSGCRFVFTDRWQDKLDAPMPWIWQQADASLTHDSDAASSTPTSWLQGLSSQAPSLVAGRRGNRSSQRMTLGSRQVYGLADRTDPWTLGQALETVAALADVDLDLSPLGAWARESMLRQNVPLDATLRDALTPLLQQARAALRVSFHATSLDRVTRRLTLMPLEAWSQRRVTLDLTPRLMNPSATDADQGPLALAPSFDSVGPAVIEISQSHHDPRSVRHQACAPGWTIESTFALQPGWDATLQGQPDATYQRSTSSSFVTYQHVYRRWVLNEDARFCQPPVSLPSAFDLAAFFSDASVSPQPLRFSNCLTLSDTGQRLEPIVEFSTDSGSTWHHYGGSYRIESAFAGVYLDDDALPVSVFSAAKAGTLKLRITASLHSPSPVIATRWTGHGLGVAFTTGKWNPGPGFEFRRVATTSRFRSAIDQGTMQADEADDRLALNAWLTQQVIRHWADPSHAGSPSPSVPGPISLTSSPTSFATSSRRKDDSQRVTVTLAGSWPQFEPGTSLGEIPVPVDCRHWPTAGTSRGVIEHVRCDWHPPLAANLPHAVASMSQSSPATRSLRRKGPTTTLVVRL